MDELQKLYDLLKSNSYVSKSFDDFKDSWQDQSYKSKVYSVLKRDGLYKEDENTFYQTYGVSSTGEDVQQQQEDEELKKKEGGLLDMVMDPFQRTKKNLQEIQRLKQQESVSPSDQSSSVSPSTDQAKRIATQYSWEGGTQQVPTAEIQSTESPSVTETLGFESQASINKRQAQAKIDAEKRKVYEEERLKKEAADNLLNWRETQALKIQEEEKKKEEEARLRAESLGISKTPEFVSKLNKIDNTLFYDEEKIKNLNDEFKDYGIVINKGGIFNNKLIARTEDGRASIEIDLTPDSEAQMVEETNKLRKFLNENNRVSQDEDFLSKALRAKNMRPVARINDDGTMSTVKFVSFDNKVIPTLFPLIPGSKSTSKDAWIELPFEQALKVAKERGEVFTFKTPEEAQEFASGSWKDISQVDIEGDNFYKQRGRDYITEKRRWERYDELDDLINFFEGYDEKNEEEIKRENPNLFVNGKPRYDIKEVVAEFKKERDQLRPLVKDMTFLNQEGTSEKMRMDFDAYLAKRENEISSEAAKTFREAQSDLSIINTESLKLFGVTIDKLAKDEKYKAQNQQAYDNLIQKYADVTQLAQTAGMKYADAKTYYDAKINKEINNELTDNVEATVNAIGDGFRNGLIGDQLLALTIPGYDSWSGFKDKESAAKYISEKLSNMNKSQSRVMTRLSSAKTARDWWDVISDDPFEAMTIAASQSISQMLPYGVKIIPAIAGYSALTGAAYGGVTTGGAGVLPGFVGGGLFGLRTGTAVTGFVTEYTTSIMEAVKNNGYDPLNPQSLEQALNDQKVWDDGAKTGAARGIPIAVVDFITAGLAGKMVKPASKLASTTSKMSRAAAENLIVDPTAEAAGELVAQGTEIALGTGRQALDWNEIGLEGIGGTGSNIPNYMLNTYLATKQNTDINLAYNLTDIKKIAAENVSDERISRWANNMEQLGKIDASVNQRIQENIGLRRDAKEVLSVGGGSASSNVVSRTMELLDAKKQLTATKNRQEVYSAEIKSINEELATIGKTKKLAPVEQQTDLKGITEAIPEAQREAVGEYMINNIRYTKEQFLDKINSFTPARLLRSKIAVKGDPEVSQTFQQKVNAVQKQTTGQVSVQPEARVGEEVVQGEPTAEPQVTAGQSILSQEENKRKEELRTALAEAPSGATTITIGETTMDKNEAQKELNNIFEKEQNAPKAQPTKQATVEVFTSTPTETKAQITFTSPEGNEVSLDGNEEVAAQLYDEAVAVPVEQRTQQQNDIVQKMEPIVTAAMPVAEEVTVAEAAPVEQFTEQDRARQQELTDALAKADKRRKNITVGETTMSKADVKAELETLNQKEQASKEPAPKTEVVPAERTPEQEADLLEELMSGKKKQPTTKEKGKEKKEATANEKTAKRLRDKKIRGAMSAIDFGITQTLYNGALEFMARQVEKGTKLGNAIANTMKWIDDRMDGKKWNKGAFGKYMNDTYKVTLGDGREVEVLRDDSKETAEVINGWYQPIEQKILDTKEDKLPANKWAERLRSKEDEDLWTGVREYLEGKGNESVSKKDLLDFMRDNRVEIVEVVKGEGGNVSEIIKDNTYNNIQEELSRRGIEDENEVVDNWYYKNGSWSDVEKFLEDNNIDIDYVVEKSQELQDDTKYSQYQLPGDKSDYKEVLVTFPNKIRSEFHSSHFDEPNILVHIRMNTRTVLEPVGKATEEEFKSAKKEIEDYRKSLWDKYGKDEWQDKSTPQEISKFKELSQKEKELGVSSGTKPIKILFLEEIQSDWGQKGKKEGFAKNKVKIEKEYNDVNNEIKKLGEVFRDKYGEDMSIDTITAEELSKYQDLVTKRARLYSQLGRIQGLPAAPFVTDTNSWVKLGLKVALREAVSQGADKIAWTTGEQQNERYDLSKQVDEVNYYKTESGNYHITADKNGSSVSSGIYKESELEGILGKDIANKIINSEGKDVDKYNSVFGYDEFGRNQKYKSLTGVDLSVGGKGMKGFYGSSQEGTKGIVGGVAEKLFGQKVGEVKIDRSPDISKKTYDVEFDSNQPMGRTWLVIDEEGSVVARETNRSDAMYIMREMVKRSEAAKKEQSTQLSIDVTPELKAEVEKGLPMFENLKLSDMVRNLQIKTKGLQSNVLGVPIAIWNAGVLTAAKAIDAGVAIKDAISKGIKNIKDNYSGKFNETLAEKKMLITMYSEPIKMAREAGIGNDGIKVFLTRKGLSEDQIDTLLKYKERAEKKAPSADKIVGKPAPKKVVVDDYKQLKREINLVNKSIKEGRKTVRDAVKEMVRLFKKSKVITKLTRSDLNKIIGLMDKVYDETSLQKAVGQMFDIILKSNEDIVEISNKKRLAQLSKAFYKGVRETKKDLKAKRAMLTEQIKKMSAEGVISLAKANIIIDKINKVNLDNPDMVQRLLDYIGKVFDDAEYDSKLTNANKLRSQIKQLSKNKEKFGNLTDFAAKFAQIDPSMVSDIDQYIAMALDVKEGVSGSKFTPKGINPAAMLDINEANKYLEKTLEEQAETIKKRTADKIENLIGVDVSDLTYEKMLQLIDLIKREELEKDKNKKRELSDEINDAFGTNKDKEIAIKSLLSKMFDTYSSIIESMFRTGIDPFADTTLPADKLDFKKSDMKLVREFMNMDLNLLSRTEALKAIDALNNFIVNKSTANMATVLATYNGKKNAETALKKGLKALTLRLYFNATIGRTYAEQFASVPLFFEKLFKGATKGADIQQLMGITSLVNHKAEAEALANRITMEYINEFNKKTPNGKKFLSLYNIIERGIIADLSKTINGTESQIADEFFRRKQLIQETIEILNKSGSKQEIQQAKVIKEVFDNIAKDAKTIEDVKKKADQINIDAVQFWIDKWEGLYDEFADVALNVYNRVLDKSINYTPDRFAFLERAVDIKGLDDTGQSTFFANGNYFYKKEAGSLMKATPPSTLKKDGKADMYVNLSFDTNNTSALVDALIDIKTAADIRQIQAFTETQQFEELLPNAKDAAALKRRIDILVRNIRNKGQYVDPSFKEMIKFLDRIATWGAGLALGGFSQIPKQTLSVGVNTLINAGKLNISAIRNKDVNNFINNSGMAIANRGFDAVTELQSLDQKIEQAVDYPPAKFAKFLEDVNKAYLKIFLVNFDSMIARASWISYYEKSLKKQGISTKGIDYSTHQINQKAANYAQMMVDRQQNISDKDLAGAFFTTNNPARQFIVKTAFPFASFRMNQTMRTMNDLTVLSSKSASREDKIIAGKSLVGFAAEMATFKAVSLGLSWTWYLLAQAIRGKEEDEEKRKKRWSNMVKGQATSAVSDVFSPIPVFDAPVKYIFNSMLDQMQNIINIDEEDRYSIFTEEKANLAKSYGMYGIALDKFTKLAEVYQLAGTGRHIDSFGNEKYISPEDQNLIMASAVILTFVDLGLLPAPEITGVINNIIKTSTSEAMTKKQMEKLYAPENNKPFSGMSEKEFKEKYPDQWSEMYGPGTDYYEAKQEEKILKEQLELEIKEYKEQMESQ